MTHPDLADVSGPRHLAWQTPLLASEAVELAKASRIFRKQVLRIGSIMYKGERLDFTAAYLDGLALAHRDQVFPIVPLVFAPGDNSHTQDVERIRGEILGFERDGDHLDAIVRASNEKAAQLLRENPNVGVSVRIEQPINRADGKSWPAAIQHVLVTANPVVPGLSPWQPVDLANDDLPVIDLSTYDFAEGDLGEDPTPEQKEIEMADAPSFTPEEIAKVRALLTVMEKGEPDGEPDDSEFEMPSDEELAAIAAGLFADDAPEEPEKQQPAEVAASSDNGAVELAAQLDAQRIELAQLRAERDAERYEKLRDSLARDHGIPPRVTELAKPLLMGKRTIELSNGSSVDAGDVMRKVLTALGEHIKLIDLSSDTVYDGDEVAAAEAEAKRRADDAAAYRSSFGL
jgi:hypothetical protein